MTEEIKDDPKRIDTFDKIIKNIKEDLHKYIDNPNNETASMLYSSMGSIPFKFEEYDVWDEYINESREYMSMLFQLFADYFQSFIKKGKYIDLDVINNER